MSNQTDFSSLVASLSTAMQTATPQQREAYLKQLDEIRKKMRKNLEALKKAR